SGAAEHVGQDHDPVAQVGALHRLDDVAAALLDVVVGPDRDGLDLLLLADHVLQCRAEFDGEPPVGNKDQSNHWKFGKLRPARLAPHRPRKRAIMTMCGASARGMDGSPYIFRNAIVKAKKRELLVRFG